MLFFPADNIIFIYIIIYARRFLFIHCFHLLPLLIGRHAIRLLFILLLMFRRFGYFAAMIHDFTTPLPYFDTAACFFFSAIAAIAVCLLPCCYMLALFSCQLLMPPFSLIFFVLPFTPCHAAAAFFHIFIIIAFHILLPYKHAGFALRAL